MKHISVVTPIFNDEKTMEKVLVELYKILLKRKRSFEILCIDDASSDGSVTIARRLSKRIPSLRLYIHAQNQGIAKTYRELYAKSQGEIVVLFSLDGAWNPADVGKLLDVITQTHADIVIGVREKKRYTFWRSVVSWMYNTLLRTIFHVDALDAGSIKAFKKKVLSLPIISHGVFDEAERIIRAKKNGYSVRTIPICHTFITKKSQGIHLYHVVEACMDFVRVRVSV